MFCPNCGTQIPDGSRFCPNCGQMVQNAQTQTPASEEVNSLHPAQPAPNPKKPQKPKKPFYQKWWFWVIVVLVALMIIGGIAGSGDTQGSDQSSTSSQPTSSEGTAPEASTPSSVTASSSTDSAAQLSQEEKDAIIASIEPVIDEAWKGSLYYVDVTDETDENGLPVATVCLDSDTFTNLDSCTAAVRTVAANLAGLPDLKVSSVMFVCMDGINIVAGAMMEDLSTDPAALEVTWMGPEIPDPVTYSGSGDDVITIAPFEGVYVFHITGNAGADYFGVQSYDSSGNPLDLLVNTTDAYSGTVIDPTQSTATLEISATGDWTVEVASIYTEPTIGQGETVTGTGDAVLLVTGYGTTATITGNAEAGYFGIQSYGSTDNDLLVNTTDPYSGTVMLSGDPVILTVTAEGDWSITFD